MKSSRIGAVVGIVALLAIGAAKQSPAAEPPYTIDVILSATGAGAFLGGTQVQALGLLEAEINKSGGVRGRPIHFAISDDGTSPQTAVQLANQVIARHAPIVLGATLSAQCKAMMPLMTDTVQYCFSPAIDPTPGSRVFSAMIATPDLFRASVRYARERGFTRIALLTPTDATGQDGDRAMARAMSLPENSGLKVVAMEHFGASDLSVTAQIAQIHAANPQYIIAWASGTAIATVLRAINDAGIDVPVVTSTANETFGQMAALQSVLPRGGLFFPSTQLSRHELLRPGPLKDAQDRLIAAYKAIGQPAQPQACTAWDPALVTIDALRHLGFNASARDIHAYIENLRGFSGTIGVYNYSDGSQRGVGLNAVVMSRWIPDRHDWVAVSSSGGAKL
jgi:branched-chain amino acid transport system substrate-binding protein